MTPTDFDEYNALRATIRERGTTRVWVVLIGTLGWAAVALASAAVAHPARGTLRDACPGLDQRASRTGHLLRHARERATRGWLLGP